MADDEDKRGSRDNTGREHKPDHAQNKENAPTGSQGTNRIKAPTLGLDGRRQQNRTAEPGKKTEHTQDKYHDPTNDPRPVFFETDDKEINDFYSKTHRMISKDQPGRGVVSEGQDRSNGKNADRSGQDGRDITANSQEAEKAQGASKGGLTAQDVFNKMAQDRAQERDRGR